MTEPFITDKAVYFTNFIVDCIRNPQLKSCYFLMEFLSLEDPTQFS